MRNGTNAMAGGRRAMATAIGLTWLVLAVLVALGARQFRDQVRAQIVGRDGEILLTLARTLQAEEADEDLAADPLVVMVSMARLRGIVAARLYDTNGGFVASVPVAVSEGELTSAELARLGGPAPVSRFLPALDLAGVFLSTNLLVWEGATNSMPAVEVRVPLLTPEGDELMAIAEFLIDGRGVAREFDRLDRRLVRQAGVVLGAAVAITGTVLGWAFRRLNRAHRLLARRTDALQRANQELARSARVAALGAVTAHLIHGLKNPVSGLHSFVSARPEGGTADDGAWRDALAATRRMQGLIEQVVRVLREHESDLAYEVTLREVGEAVLGRVQAAAERRGVQVLLEGDPPVTVDNRTSGLLALLLTNLMENGIDATPRGRRVRLVLGGTEAAGISARVADEGSGLSAEARERLFQPQQSRKEGGSGLGLAITHQLALALGGSVSLVSSAADGTVFRVDLPRDHREVPPSPGAGPGLAAPYA